MHPLAPSCAPTALVNQTEVVRKRRRRGKPGIITVLRAAVVSSAALGVTVFVLWLKQETPHPNAAIAERESPLVQARSLKSPLETVGSSGLAAYGLKKNFAPAPLPEVVQPPPVPVVNRVVPVWLMMDIPEFADAKSAGLSPAQTIEQLRQSLREAGARQMGQSVRFGMLNLSELLAMEPRGWAASLDTLVAKENRASAMLLTFYLTYLDRAGDGAGVKALLRALDQGMNEESAVREFILKGRSVAELEREMGRVFADAGVELRFMRRGGMAFRQ
ncbi:hypothetical protein [Prosthecobacter sp.]|uniref:hypothetical protein n=1 Tax=Prosthecobacter sp. TaxID=1965333 RepID=UPI00248A2A2F|nr:hypothetical protein [Prosthecobacter sp.]MDI1311496.1 hypothetical protein [Prosthecobacter sp.]